MLAWESLTNAIDELDSVRAQLDEARGQTRTARFYELIRARLVLSQGGGHAADVIEISGGRAILLWLHSPRRIEIFDSFGHVEETYRQPGNYLLVLVSSSDRMMMSNSRESTTRLPLTTRQRKLLRCIGHGLSNAEIACKTGFAHSTVKNQLSRLYRYLDVNDRTQAALIARDLDLGPPLHKPAEWDGGG